MKKVLDGILVLMLCGLTSFAIVYVCFGAVVFADDEYLQVHPTSEWEPTGRVEVRGQEELYEISPYDLGGTELGSSPEPYTGWMTAEDHKEWFEQRQ